MRINQRFLALCLALLLACVDRSEMETLVDEIAAEMKGEIAE